MGTPLPSPRCNLNNVILPEVPLRKILLDVSYIIIFCTVEKCSSSSATSAFRCPILSWRSLTTKPNRVPSREQNLLEPSDRLYSCHEKPTRRLRHLLAQFVVGQHVVFHVDVFVQNQCVVERRANGRHAEHHDDRYKSDKTKKKRNSAVERRRCILSSLLLLEKQRRRRRRHCGAHARADDDFILLSRVIRTGLRFGGGGLW